MGWKITTIAAFFAAAMIFSAGMQPAHATAKGWLMCWVPSDSNGGRECVRLPSRWRINGVPKAYCSRSGYYCSRSVVRFRINRRNLWSMSHYASVSTRDYGATVTIYSRTYR